MLPFTGELSSGVALSGTFVFKHQDGRKSQHSLVHQQVCPLHLPNPTAHPQVSISQVCSSRVGSIDGLFAVDLDDAAVLDVPDVLQLVEDVARLVLDQDGRIGGLKHTCGQLLREHVHDESVQRVQAAQLVGDVHPACLIAVLQEQHA